MKGALSLYQKLGQCWAKAKPPAQSARRGSLSGPADVWMHASSVGEATVAAALLKEILAQRPDLQVTLTLFTETGKKKAEELLAGLPVRVSLAPYDVKDFVIQALKGLNPKVLALIETELWPNYISLAKAQGVKVILLNGRISARSFPRYRLARPLFAPLLRSLDGAAVIGEPEARRFMALGLPKERLKVLPNAKHDLLWKRAQAWQEAPLRKRLGLSPAQMLFVFGSVRKGEEALVVQTIKALWPRKELCFAVVPRHPDRLAPWEKALAQKEFSWRRWTQLSPAGLDKRVLLVDTVGPLFGLYALAQVAYVGGSLAPKGGQNPMEPAAFGVPVFFGPHMENFENEKKALCQTGGGAVVTSAEQLVFQVEELLQNPTLYEQAAQGAKKALQSLLGGARRQARWFLRYL